MQLARPSGRRPCTRSTQPSLDLIPSWETGGKVEVRKGMGSPRTLREQLVALFVVERFMALFMSLNKETICLCLRDNIVKGDTQSILAVCFSDKERWRFQGARESSSYNKAHTGSLTLSSLEYLALVLLCDVLLQEFIYFSFFVFF